MVKVGDLITDPKGFSWGHRTIVEIIDTEESISFFTGISIISKSSESYEVRNEIIYLKKEDTWVWTGEGDIQVCKQNPKFYLEITKEMDRNQRLDYLLT